MGKAIMGESNCKVILQKRRLRSQEFESVNKFALERGGECWGVE